MTAATIMPADIVAAARSWLGTPYHHQAAVKGVGCDCLGLVRGVYEELYGRPAETPPPYSRDWAEASSTETMIEAARRHLTPIGLGEAGQGDIVIFRLRPGAMAKHAAILTGEGRMIHAMEGAPACEVHISSWWRRRMAAAFRFPERTFSLRHHQNPSGRLTPRHSKSELSPAVHDQQTIKERSDAEPLPQP